MRLMESSRLRRRIAAANAGLRSEVNMSSLKVTLGLLAAGLMLSGCIQGATYEAPNTNNFMPRDEALLAKVSYVTTPVPDAFRSTVDDDQRKAATVSIAVRA